MKGSHCIASVLLFVSMNAGKLGSDFHEDGCFLMSCAPY